MAIEPIQRRREMKAHKHNLKLVAFDEQTGIAIYQCRKCCEKIERKARFLCKGESE